MPIEKGQEWGQPGVLPESAPVASTDAQAASFVRIHDVIGLSGGDLARTLGIGAGYDRSSAQHLVLVDAIDIELDNGDRHLCIAHATIGVPLRHGRAVAVMNAAFIGRRNIAPRAHPGDGKVDLVTLNLGLSDRVKAWRRMPTASHVPHPDIDVRRKASGTVEMDSKRAVRIDGRRVGTSRALQFTVVPNAITIAVS